MNVSDLVGLLVLLVVYRLIRGVLGRVGRAVTSRDTARSGPGDGRETVGDTGSVPEPPRTDARRRAARIRSSEGHTVAASQPGVAEVHPRGSEGVDDEGPKRASGGTDKPKESGRDGPFDELMRESPLVGGIVMREVLGPPRAANPYRPLKR